MMITRPRAHAILAVLSALALTACGAPDAAKSSADAPMEAATADDLSTLNVGVDDVSFVSDEGQTVRWGDLNGAPRIVFFGFTRCPTICPVTIWEVGNALKQIDAAPDAVRMDFITVDPARDTPEVINAYLNSFDGNVMGLHAEGDALARITRAFDVTYESRPVEGGDYTIDHTATVFLLNSRGQVVDVVAFGSPPDVIAERLRGLLAAG